MSVDVLQEKIRKTKNPSVVLFEAIPELIPPEYFDGGVEVASGCASYFGDLLCGLKDVVPAVRFGLGSFLMLGRDGMGAFESCLKRAKELGFYVFVDLPEILSPVMAEHISAVASNLNCDAFVVGTYLGSDVLSPMKRLCKAGKAVFSVVRTANKSAAEIQDLMTGGRLVHTAAADIINRHGESVVGKCGYSHFGAVAAASSADSLRTLRNKYSRMFLLLDGFDYPNANAKNCSFAFDKFGHGAVACAFTSVISAWKENDNGEKGCIDAAVIAAERMKKNLTRYVSVL